MATTTRDVVLYLPGGRKDEERKLYNAADVVQFFASAEGAREFGYSALRLAAVVADLACECVGVQITFSPLPYASQPFPNQPWPTNDDEGEVR